jgi:hypothetical protein
VPLTTLIVVSFTLASSCVISSWLADSAKRLFGRETPASFLAGVKNPTFEEAERLEYAAPLLLSGTPPVSIS